MGRLFDAKMGFGSRMKIDIGRGFDDILEIMRPEVREQLRVVLETGAFRAANIVKDEISRLYREDRVPGHPSLHPFTIAKKGHGRPLRHMGDLAKSVIIQIERKGKDRVDFLITVEKAQQMKANIAETGAVVPVTKRMRNFLAAAGLRLRESTRFITIPPRPVFNVALRNSMPEMNKVMAGHLRQTPIGRKFL